MRIAVTGATGFLGRHIAQLGRERGHEIVAIGRGDAATVRIDLLGAIAPIAKAFDCCDCVIHAAMPREGTDRTISTMTQNVCDSATESGVRRLVYVSSIGVIDPGIVDVSEKSPVDANPEHRDAYARGKIWSETIVTSWAGAGGNIACIARPGPILGGQRQWSDRFGVKVGGRWIRIGSAPIPWISVERCAADLITLATISQPVAPIHLQEKRFADNQIIDQLIFSGRLSKPVATMSYRAARRLIQLMKPMAQLRGKSSRGLFNLRRFDARFRPRTYACQSLQ